MYWVVLVLQCPALPNYRKKEKGDLSPTVYASLSVYNQFIYHGLSSPHASQQQQPAQLHAQQQTQSISTLLSTTSTTACTTTNTIHFHSTLYSRLYHTQHTSHHIISRTVYVLLHWFSILILLQRKNYLLIMYNLTTTTHWAPYSLASVRPSWSC